MSFKLCNYAHFHHLLWHRALKWQLWEMAFESKWEAKLDSHIKIVYYFQKERQWEIAVSQGSHFLESVSVANRESLLRELHSKYLTSSVGWKQKHKWPMLCNLRSAFQILPWIGRDGEQAGSWNINTLSECANKWMLNKLKQSEKPKRVCEKLCLKSAWTINIKHRAKCQNMSAYFRNFKRFGIFLTEQRTEINYWK